MKRLSTALILIAGVGTATAGQQYAPGSNQTVRIVSIQQEQTGDAKAAPAPPAVPVQEGPPAAPVASPQTPATASDAVQPAMPPPVANRSAAACGEANCGEGSCGESACSPMNDCLLDKIFSDKPLFPGLKNQQLGPLTYSAGGQIRHRYMNEENRFRPPGPGESQYQLWRTTNYVDFAYDDVFAARFESINAEAFGYDAPYFPVGIDRNYWDLLQAYADIKVMDVGDNGYLKYRYGRQFLKYGSQHLLSPLAWANTFRNFEGHKLMYKNGDWAVDAFHMKSVNAAAGGSDFSVSRFDRPDEDRTITGVYGTYSGLKNSVLDLYWLHTDEQNDNVARMDGERDTFGARLAGSQAIKECDKVVGTWNWDFEGAWQTGTDDFLTGANQDVSAYFVSLIGGYQFNDLPWAPKLNGIFYYGSGDDDPADGDLNTFYSIYPLAHAYWGIIDNFSGQNLIDAGVSLTLTPHKKLSVVAAWHNFQLAQANDNLYNIVGAPFALAGDDIGTEIDVIATLKISKNLNTQLGYQKFFYGSGVNNSGFARDDAQQIYLQTTFSY